MHYTIEDLKNEFDEWLKCTFEDLENILDLGDFEHYEMPNVDIDSLLLFKRDIPPYYKLVHEGIWENNFLMDSEYEAIEVLAGRMPSDSNFNHLASSIAVRIKLNEGHESLTISELALLAGIDERTVRNAASTGKKTLKTIKVGSSTMIESAEAERWLSGRRGYRPTIIKDVMAEKPKQTIHEEIYHFVEENQTTLEEVMKESDFSKERINVLKKSKNLDKDINGLEVMKLEQGLKLVEFSLVRIMIENSIRSAT